MEHIATHSITAAVGVMCQRTAPVLRLSVLAAVVTVLCFTCSTHAQDKVNLYRSPMLSPCHKNTNKAQQTFVRDPLDCSLFYTCFGNRFWKMSCQTPGTVYSLKYKVCVWRNSLFDDCTNGGGEVEEERVVKTNLLQERGDVKSSYEVKDSTDKKDTWSHKTKGSLYPRYDEDSALMKPQRDSESNQVTDSKDTQKHRPNFMKGKKKSGLIKSKTHLKKNDNKWRTTKDNTKKLTKKKVQKKKLKHRKDKTKLKKKKTDKSKDWKSIDEYNKLRRINNDDTPKKRKKYLYPSKSPFVPKPKSSMYPPVTLPPPTATTTSSTTTAAPTTTTTTRPSTTTTTTTSTTTTTTRPTTPERTTPSTTTKKATPVTTPTPTTTTTTTTTTTQRQTKETPQWQIITAKPEIQWKANTVRPPVAPRRPHTTSPLPIFWWKKVVPTTKSPQRQQEQETKAQRPRNRFTLAPPPSTRQHRPTARPHQRVTISPRPRWHQKPSTVRPPRRQTPRVKQQQRGTPFPRTRVTPVPQLPRNQQTQRPLRTKPVPTTRPKQDDDNPRNPRFKPFPFPQQHKERQQQKPRQQLPPRQRTRPTRPPRGRQSPYLTPGPRVTPSTRWWVKKTPSPPRFRPQTSRPPRVRLGPDHLKIVTTPEPVRWWKPTAPRQRHTTTTTTTTSKPGKWLGWTQRPKVKVPTTTTTRPTTTEPTMTTALSTTTMANFRESRNTWQTSPTVRSTWYTSTTATLYSTTPPPPPSTKVVSTSLAPRTLPTSTLSSTPESITLPHRAQMAEHCGIMASPMIIGGSPSDPGQWPWQVSLQIIAAVEPWHRCGGVLIHQSWVLTAAHCVEGPFYGDVRNWRVVLAEDNLEVESGREIYRRIARIVSHPGYIRTSNFPNDVALLQLDEGVDLTSGEVRVACLPDQNTPPPDLDNCWISGWGETRDSGGHENAMNELPVKILDNQDCASMWLRVGIHVLDDQLCVGHGDTGACYGDSGGPLMCEQEGRYYISGVMSWLINNCSARGFPNVFTRVTSYLDWIYEKLDFYEWWRYN